MSDEVTPSSAHGTDNAQPSEATEAPSDFREYARWRATGELPEQKDEAVPAVEEETPKAKTEPDSEPDGTEQAEDDEENGEDSAAKLKGGSRSRKLDRTIQERNQERAEKERFRQENDELKRLIAQTQDRPSVSAANDKPPEPTDFKTLADYQIGLTDWRIEQRERQRQEAEQARQQTEAKAAQEAAEQQLLTDWDKKIKAVRKAHPDYDDVVAAGKIQTGPAVMAVRQALLEDDHGAEIFYHLASNPKEFETLMQMSPARAVIAIGKLSTSFDSPSSLAQNGKQRISNASPPPQPIRHTGKATADSTADPAVQKDFKRYVRAREAELKGR